MMELNLRKQYIDKSIGRRMMMMMMTTTTASGSSLQLYVARYLITDVSQPLQDKIWPQLTSWRRAMTPTIGMKK